MPAPNRKRVVDLFATRPVPPPSEWGAKKKRLWREVVGAFSPDYFRASDRRVLCAYIDAVDLHDRMGELIDREGAVLVDGNGRKYPNPAASVQHQAALRIASLGGKLRIHASARMRSDSAHALANKTPSSVRPPWDFDDRDGETKQECIEHKYFD